MLSLRIVFQKLYFWHPNLKCCIVLKLLFLNSFLNLNYIESINEASPLLGENPSSRISKYSVNDRNKLGKSNLTEAIIDIIALGQTSIEIAKEKEAIIILGSYSTAKTVLSLFLSNLDNLWIEEFEEEEDEDGWIDVNYFFDLNDKIFPNQTSDSTPPNFYTENNIPHVLHHAETNTPIYDFPGFDKILRVYGKDETKIVTEELAADYFRHRVVNHLEKVKIVMAINYIDIINIKEGNSLVDNLLTQVLKFLGNVDVFKNSICVVVTNVDPEWESDSECFSSSFSADAPMREIEKKLKMLLSSKEKVTVEDEIASKSEFKKYRELINIFLQTNGENNFTHIGLLYKPFGPTAGSIANQEAYIVQRTRLWDMISDNIQFAEIINHQFGLTISEGGITRIQKHVKINIGATIAKKMKKLGEFMQYCYQKKVDESKDYQLLNSRISEEIKILQSRTDKLRNSTNKNLKFLETLANTLVRLNIPFPNELYSAIDLQFNSIYFLQDIIQQSFFDILPFEDWVAPLKTTISILKQYNDWFDFLLHFHTRLSSREVQLNKAKYNVKNVSNWGVGDSEKTDGIYINGNNYEEFCLVIKKKELIVYHPPTNIDVQRLKLLTSLNEVLNETLKHQNKIQKDENAFLGSGSFILLSEIFEKNNILDIGNIPTIKIFATDTIFIDTDLKNFETNLVLIAPSWKIEKGVDFNTISDTSNNCQSHLNESETELTKMFLGITSAIFSPYNWDNFKDQSGIYFLCLNYFSNTKDIFGDKTSEISIPSIQKLDRNEEKNSAMQLYLINSNNISQSRLNESKLADSNHFKEDLQKHIYDYKYWNESCGNKKQRSKMDQFINEIAKTNSINELYDAASFAQELIELNKKFWQKIECIDFVDEYSLFLIQIENYLTKFKHSISDQEKVLLARVYTAAYSQKLSLSSYETTLVKNVIPFFDQTLDLMDEIQNKRGEKIKFKATSNCNENIQRRRSEIKKYLQIDIKEEFDKNSEQISKDSDALIKEINTIVDHENQRVAELKEKINQLTVNLIGTIFFTVVDVSAKLYTALGDDDNVKFKQLAKITEAGSQFSQNVLQTVTSRKFRNTDNSNDNYPSDYDDFVDGVVVELDTILDDINNFHNEQLLTPNVYRVGFDKWVTAGTIILPAVASLIGNVKNTINQNDELKKIASKLNKRIDNLLNYTKIIAQTVKAMLQSLKEWVENAQRSDVYPESLEISKLKIQPRISQINVQIKNIMIELQEYGSTKGNNLINSFEQLERTMTTMTNLHEDLSQLESEKNLIEYISVVNSQHSFVNSIENEDLKSRIYELEEIIHSNVVNNYYNLVMKTVRLLLFPFAKKYLPSFEILPTNNMSTTVEIMRDQIENLKNKLLENYNSIEGTEDSLWNNYIYGIQSPFAEWNVEKYGSEISRLLSGKTIFLIADIKTNIFQNAVKISHISLNFSPRKGSNLTISDIKSITKSYSYNLVHSGYSHFGCDYKYYTIKHPSLDIAASFEEGKLQNDVAIKLNGSNIISPYTSWQINLQNIEMEKDNFGTLASLNGMVDLQLVGKGKFVDHNSAVCVDLDKYYKEDEDIGNRASIYIEKGFNQHINLNSRSENYGDGKLKFRNSNAQVNKKLNGNKIKEAFKKQFLNLQSKSFSGKLNFIDEIELRCYQVLSDFINSTDKIDPF